MSLNGSRELLARTFEELMLEHLSRYRESEWNDWYKLMYQVCMGPEHSFGPGMIDRLNREFEEVDAEDVPLLEPIGIMRPMARLQLRGAKYQGIGPEFILSAMMGPEDAKGTTDELTALLGFAADWLRPITPRVAEELVEHVNELAAAGFPAVHHSETYRERYRPAYRVVRRLPVMTSED